MTAIKVKKNTHCCYVVGRLEVFLRSDWFDLRWESMHNDFSKFIAE